MLLTGGTAELPTFFGYRVPAVTVSSRRVPLCGLFEQIAAEVQTTWSVCDMKLFWCQTNWFSFWEFDWLAGAHLVSNFSFINIL